MFLIWEHRILIINSAIHLRLSSEFNIILKDPTVNLKTEHVLKGKKLNTELLKSINKNRLFLHIKH